MIRFIITLFAAGIGLLLIIPLFVIISPLWVFNIMINLLYMLLSKNVTSWEKIMQFKPEIGWQPYPNLNTSYFDRIGDRCTIKTDAEGWPGHYTIDESDIIVFGDSFAFGYGSNIERSYFSQITNYRVKPIGAPGYNMVQELLLMRRYADRLKGKLVVWFICLENDLAENLKPYNPRFYTNPFIRSTNGIGDWEIVTRHVDYNKFLFGDKGISNATLFAHLCTDSDYSSRVFSSARYLIRAGGEICDEAKARLVVVSIPSKDQLDNSGLQKLNRHLQGEQQIDPDYPDKKLSEICGELHVPFIAGATYLTFSDYKLRDGHWNYRGNKKIARLIEEQCRNHCFFPDA
jgi:hypothetical protein